MRIARPKFMRSATGRLMSTYLIIIMFLSVAFSAVVYHASYHQLGRQVPPHAFYRSFGAKDFEPHVEHFLRHRIDEGRKDLLIRLVFLNLAVLLLGSLVSYWLARRTLKPIEAAMEAQDQFVGDASHELKTPLTAVGISNDVALRKPNLTLEEAKNVISQNSEDVAKLQALSEGLLRLASKSKLELAPLDISGAAAEAVNSVISLAKAKKIKINSKVSASSVMADRQSLLQILTILLDNAIKYSGSNTTINLESSRKGKFIYLQVTDQGPGIEAKDLPHIFKRFYRADRARSKNGNDGYGLGLAIADKLVREQHGEILATSDNHGTTFTIKLLAA